MSDKSTKLTDPYHHLIFCIGSGDDFVCLDYHTDHKKKRVLMHSVLNSETGSFIQDFDPPHWVKFSLAEQEARRMVESALDWLSDSPDSEPIEHDTEGWNQDPYFFVRSVAAAMHPGTRRRPVERVIEDPPTIHHPNCYHADCDEDDHEVHRCHKGQCQECRALGGRP